MDVGLVPLRKRGEAGLCKILDKQLKNLLDEEPERVIIMGKIYTTVG